jgi:hypothetical protein
MSALRIALHIDILPAAGSSHPLQQPHSPLENFMKHVYLRSCVALLCATSLAACGGSSGSLLVGGTITGLTKTGLVLTNNDGPDLAIASGATSFSFPQLIDTDANFNVQIKAQPPAAVCTMRAGTNTGKASFNVNGIVVDCVTNTYTLNAAVSGLAGGTVALTNGDNNDLTISADGTFPFPVKVADGAPYTVTVKTQPAGKNCVIPNGVATMPSAPVTIDVTCS